MKKNKLSFYKIEDDEYGDVVGLLNHYDDYKSGFFYDSTLSDYPHCTKTINNGQDIYINDSKSDIKMYCNSTKGDNYFFCEDIDSVPKPCCSITNQLDKQNYEIPGVVYNLNKDRWECNFVKPSIPVWQCDKNTLSCNSTLEPDRNKSIFYKESTCENDCIGKWYCDDPTKNKCTQSLTIPSDLPDSCARGIGKGTPKKPTGDFIGYDTEKQCQYNCFKPFLTHGNPPAGCVNGDIGFCDEVSSISGDIPGNQEPKGNIPYVGQGQSCECPWFSTNGQTYGDQYGGCGSTNLFWHDGYWTSAIRCVPGTKAHSYSPGDTEHVWCE